MEPSTRQSLVLRLRNLDDDIAWMEFVQLYKPLVLGLAKSKGLQDADAQDLCQELFQAVAGAIDRWDSAKGKFRAWLLRIARNLTVNFLVRQRRQARGSGRTSMVALLEAQPVRDAGAEAEFAAEFKRRAFHWAADQARPEFTDSTWQAFWQTGVENRPIGEVAAELGLSEGAVYVARCRVLARLRSCVQGLTGDAGLDDPEGST